MGGNDQMEAGVGKRQRSLALKGRFCLSLMGVIMAAAVAMVAMAAPAKAQRLEDTVIRGFDYSVIKVPRRAGDEFCERACNDDPNCRAYTFIRGRGEIDAQCRLKHDVGPQSANACCVSGVKRDRRIAEDDQSARSEDRCAAFASRAVQLQNRNLAERCGYRGQIWHSDYNKHYRYCLRADREDFRAYRQELISSIEECRGSGRRIERIVCEHYAKMSVEQARAADAARCGFDRVRRRDYGAEPTYVGDWDLQEDNHYQWCAAQATGVWLDQISRRERELLACFKRGGGPLNEQCENYARLAVIHFEKNRDKRCGNRGPQWHSNEERHYNWCASVDFRIARQESEQRERSLRACGIVNFIDRLRN